MKRLAFLILLFASAAAHAVPVTWTVQGAMFDDGGTLTGSFVWDSDTRAVVSYDLWVSGGNTAKFAPFNYKNGAAHNTRVWVGSFIFFDTDLANPPYVDASRQLRLPVSASVLTDLGGRLTFDLTNENIALECFNCSPSRLLVSGGLLAGVPEPATAGLLALAVTALALGRRRLARR
jgi:hypothetical protein